jgi:hypothetical protein
LLLLLALLLRLLFLLLRSSTARAGGGDSGVLGSGGVGSGVLRAALFGRAVVVCFKTVLETEGLMAELAGNGDELLFAAAFESARVLSRLDGSCGTACANVLLAQAQSIHIRGASSSMGAAASITLPGPRYC